MRTTRVKISGQVQGVSFRKFLKDEADKIGLKGHVRNLDSGEVEVIAEGAPEEVEKMITICKKGNSITSVKGVDLQDMNHIGFDDFKILNI